jgi:CRP-like cAMP-binding protein
MNNPVSESAIPDSPDAYAYDPMAARSFFMSAGEEVAAEAGSIIFEEDEKGNRFFRRDKMYLLLAGEIELTIKGMLVGAILPGEIFGELATISHSPRSATARAKTNCRLIALDDKQFRAALREHPDFSLTMLTLMVGRLRKMLGKLKEDSGIPVDASWNESEVFDKKMLAELVDRIGRSAVSRYLQNRTIIQEGQIGLLMYVVLEGYVEFSIQGRVVEEVGPGGMFGELALIGSSERLASARAMSSEVSLLAIKRRDFLDLVQTDPEFGVALLTAVSERARFVAACFAL